MNIKLRCERGPDIISCDGDLPEELLIKLAII